MLRSQVRDIAWPAIPNADGARMLALQFQFTQSERWPPAEVEAQQFRQIEALVAFCHHHIPFWRDRLRRAGIRPGQRLNRRLWSQLPVLTRRQAQEAGDALRATDLPPGHGAILNGATSGSTGMPLRFARSEIAQFFWLAANLRPALWHNVAFAGATAVIKQMAVGEDIPTSALGNQDWGAGFEAFATGPVMAIDSRRPPQDQVDWLAGCGAAHLITRPSNAARLALHCQATSQRPPALRRIFALGEMVTPGLRALCRDVLGVEMIDIYSAEEGGVMALQCPAHDHLHVLAEVIRLEVLDERDRPCAPGQVGRVVVTPLHNFAMPLLRYEIGDHAEPGPPCSCGRTLPVLTRVIGRAGNRIVLPNGESRMAHWGGERFHQVAGIIQYQVAQLAPDLIEYRLVVRNPLTAADEAFLTGMLHRSIGHPIPVRFAYVDDIPRAASGKHQEFVSEIPP